MVPLGLQLALGNQQVRDALVKVGREPTAPRRHVALDAGVVEGRIAEVARRGHYDVPEDVLGLGNQRHRGGR